MIAWLPVIRSGLVAILLGSYLGMNTAQAQVGENVRWSFTPRLSVAQTYSDNVGLQPRGEESSDLITEVSPGFGIAGRSRRQELDVDYSLVNRLYWRDSDRSNTSHQVSLSSTTEVVRDRGFFDARAQRREAAFSLLGPVGLDGDVGDQNLREVTTWQLGPRYEERFGSFATLNSRYQVDGIHYSGRNTPDRALGQQAAAEISSGPTFTRFDWSVQGDWQRTDFRDEDRVILSSASGTLGFAPTPRTRVFGTSGREWNDFATERDLDTDDTFWSVGGSWSPTIRTTLEASYGERFFGTTRTFSITQRNRHMVFRASRQQSVSSAVDRFDALLGAEPIFVGGCDPGDPDCDPVALLPIFDSVTFRRVVESDQTRLSLTFNRPKSAWTISADRIDTQALSQDDSDLFERAEDNRRQDSVTGRMNWRLAPRTSFTAIARYADIEFSDIDREDQLYTGQLTLSRTIGQLGSGSLSYRHQRRDSDNDSAEYRENAVIARMTFTF